MAEPPVAVPVNKKGILADHRKSEQYLNRTRSELQKAEKALNKATRAARRKSSALTREAENDAKRAFAAAKTKLSNAEAAHDVHENLKRAVKPVTRRSILGR